MSNHATVQRDGYTVPLIGVPPEATTDHCDLCGDVFGLSQLELCGKQLLCERCRRTIEQV